MATPPSRAARIGALAILGQGLALGLVAAPLPLLARERAVPEAVPDGKPVNCLSLRQIRSSSVRSDQIIDFRTAGGKIYRNTLPMSCPSLGFEERFAYRTSIGRLCAVDMITVLQSPGLTPGVTCGLGQFQPVKLIKPAAK